MKLNGKGIGCIRGGRHVLDNVNFMAEEYVPLMVKGPNGAGKSTLLRLVAGLVEYQEGGLTWLRDDGEPVGPDVEPSSLFHYVGHLDVVKQAFTVAENLSFWADLYGVPGDVDVALERMDLVYLRDVPGAYLSAGQKRRAALARLLIGKRPLWIMDEPTVSLDVEGVAMVVGLMKEHCAAGGMLMVTTHVEIGLDEVARLDLPRLGGV